MNYYPEQMDAISDLCKVLNEWGKRHAETYFYLKELVLYTADSDDEVFGRLRDEIGDSWSFTPADKES